MSNRYAGHMGYKKSFEKILEAKSPYATFQKIADCVVAVG